MKLACVLFFFFNDTATTEIYTLSLHDALPICNSRNGERLHLAAGLALPLGLTAHGDVAWANDLQTPDLASEDRKSTRLNSSHSQISYAVFCLKKKKHNQRPPHVIIIIIRSAGI